MRCTFSSIRPSLLAAAVLAFSLSTSAVAAGPEIIVLSNRADLVSGGDALVQINLPPFVDPARGVKVALNGTLINNMFAVRPNGRYQGLVTGLNNGDNLLTVHTTQGGAKLTITNHPIGGPVFSGAQVQPWICATPTPVPESGNTPASNASGLTTVAFDSQCNIATEYKLFYRTTTSGCSTALPDPSPPTAPPTNNCFKPYTLGSTPSDLAMTTTTTGLTVPYIVRVERGTINREIGRAHV